MSLESMSLVWAHSQAEGSALLALLAIADHDGDGGSWPSMDTIAQHARVTRETARKLVRKLEELGEITTDRNGGGGLRTANHMRTNRYEITLECPPSCDRSARHRERTEVIHTPLRTEGPPHGGAPSVRRGTPPPHGGANHPRNTLKGNSEQNLVDNSANDREISSSNQAGAEPDSISGIFTDAEQAAYAAHVAHHQRVKRPDLGRPGVPDAPRYPRYDPRTVPEPPPPVSPAQRAANQAAAQLPCRASPSTTGRHFIPAGTGTACIYCNTPSTTILDQANQLETTP
ncbi:MAG: helix-turn-helix domain-containing protein [Microthrixaceae bacterium]